jgi:uncharacterized lipoprotein YmbA
MDKGDLVRVCYDWQVNNSQYDGWAKKLGKDLNNRTRAHLAEPKHESEGHST